MRVEPRLTPRAAVHALVTALATALVVVVVVAACVPPPAGRPSPGSPGPGSSPSAVPAPTGGTPAPTFSRPTPTPRPTFLAYVVQPGDTLSSIARAFGTTALSIAYWNRAAHPSLDPESDAYRPDQIRSGWTLLLIPNGEVDEDDLPPAASPSPAPPSTAAPSPTAGSGGPSTIVRHGRRDDTRVALTFDLGGRLDPALDIMAWLVEHRVPATIFPTGASAETQVGREVLRIVADHPELFDLGNHSWSHASFVELDAARIRTELDDTEALLSELTGTTSRPWFRPPYGAIDDAALRAIGAAGWASTVMWDLDTIDWRAEADGGPTAADIERKVVEQARNGSIVLLHLGGWNTLEALPGLVDGLRERGLEPATLDALLGG